MKIILLTDVKGLGKKYEVKDVKEGYGRNFLLARKLAKLADPEALKDLERLRARMDRDEAATKKNIEEMARTLSDRYLEFHLKTGKDGSVFGAVNKEMILKAMREHGFLGKERVEIKLAKPLKEIGDHVVLVELKRGTEVKLKVVIRSQP